MARKSQVFCLRFNSKTKQKPATKIQNRFSITLKTTCKNSANFEQKKEKQPKSSLIPFYD